MRTPSKLLLGLTTAATVVAPMVPKTINITINEESAIVARATEPSCRLLATLIDDRGRRFCEYRCGTEITVKPAENNQCESNLRSK